MTPEQLRELRAALPRFGDAATAPPGLGDFCRYYGIDFAGSDPSLVYRAGTVRSGQYSLCVHFWSRPGASSNLLLLHGYFDHTGLFGKLIEYGLSRNCNVLIFDLPGHGLSGGEPAVIDDFRDYSQAIADVLQAVRLPSLPLWVMGQSTGCAALVDYAGKRDWPFATMVLLAPLVRPMGWLRVRVAHMLLQHFVDSVPRKFNQNSSDRAFLEFVQRDPLQSERMPLRWIGALRRWLGQLPARDLGVGPALVLQGDADGTVAWKYNLKVVDQLFPGSVTETLPGAGHQLANESADILQLYQGIIDAWLLARGISIQPGVAASEQHPAANGPLDAGELGQGDVAVLRVDVDDHIAD